MTPTTSYPTWDHLAPGDLRTIGASEQVAARAVSDPVVVDDLVAGLSAAEPGLRMRCADALEKATRDLPRLLAPHQAVLLELALRAQQHELQWHLAQLVPRLALDDHERALVVTVMSDLAATSPSSIVRAHALQSVVDLAADHPAHARTARLLLARAAEDHAPAVRARGRRLAGRC